MIVYYSPTILTDSGFPESTALQVSIALGVAYLLAQLGGLSIIDRVGRRRLTLIMIPGAALSLVALGLLLVTGQRARRQVCTAVPRRRLGQWANGPISLDRRATAPRSTAGSSAIRWCIRSTATGTPPA
jgi:MFS family permease